MSTDKHDKKSNEHLTPQQLVADALAQLNLERGLFRTFVDLTIRPGRMLHCYLETARRSEQEHYDQNWLKDNCQTARADYVGVVTYLALSVAISVLILSFHDPYPDAYNARIDELRSQFVTPEQQESFDKFSTRTIVFLNFSSQYREIIYYLIIPILALCTFWAFRLWRLSYLEHVVLAGFVIAHQAFLSLPLYAVHALLQLNFDQLGAKVGWYSWVYAVWVWVNFSERYNISNVGWKVADRIESVFLSLVALFIWFGIGVLLWVVWLFLI